MDDDLLDELMADGLVQRAFMTLTLVRLARQTPDPDAFARRFVEALSAAVDRSEALATLPAAHARARARIDAMGSEVAGLLRALPEP